MMTIHKFRLDLGPNQSIMLPFGAQILSAGFQDFDLYAWVAIDTEERRLCRHEFSVYVTGQDLGVITSKRLNRFFGTYHRHDGFVAHLFLFGVWGDHG